MNHLYFSSSEARDAARSTRLVKSITVQHQKVSNMSPQVQHQVLKLSFLLTIILILVYVRPASWLFSCVTGVAECFGDIWPDGESYSPYRRDHRGKAEDPKLNWGAQVSLLGYFYKHSFTLFALFGRYRNMHWLQLFSFLCQSYCKQM